MYHVLICLDVKSERFGSQIVNRSGETHGYILPEIC